MRIFTLLLVLLVSINTFGQQARVKKYTTPLAGSSILKDAEDKYNAEVFNLESPSPDGNVDKQRLKAVKEEIKIKYPRKKSGTSKAKSTQAASPVVLAGFVADSFSGIPPDNSMAISNGNKSASVMNSAIAVQNPVTGQVVQKKSLNSYATAAGLPTVGNPNNYKYDPKIIYDPEQDRFICVLLNGTNQFNWIVFGFSQTNDPAGAWNFYKLYGDYAADTTWFDYPAISITHNELFLTGNKITYNGSWQTGFRQTVIYQVKKSDGYNAAPVLNYQLWDSINPINNVYIRNLCPVLGGGAIYGPEQYFVSNRNLDIQNDTIFLVKIPDTIGSTNTNLSITVLQTPLAYGVPPDGRQNTTFDNTIEDLTTNDGRILGAFIESDQIQFVNASLNTGNGSAGIYHGVISNVSSSPTVTGNIFSVDTLDFGYPNLSFSGNQGGNTSIISFDYTGPNAFAGLGAIYYDGSQFSDMLKIRQGDSVIDVMTGVQRWGDYTGSQTYWPAIGKVWVVGIYGKKNRGYGNYMAEIGIPSLAGVANEQQKKNAGKVFPNPAFDYIQAEFSVSTAQQVDFSIYDITGRMVDKLYTTYCKKGANLIQFNIAPLAKGSYVLKGVNTDGAIIMTNKFIRQ